MTSGQSEPLLPKPVGDRTLFVFGSLPKAAISIPDVLAGEEALSGTHGSASLVAEGLARRGHEIGALVLDGHRFEDARFPTFSSADEAARWIGDGRSVWVYHGNDPLLTVLNRVGLRPSVWSHTDVSPPVLEWLRTGQARELIVVSDSARLALLRSSVHARIGRIYNPLPPAYESPVEPPAASNERFRRKQVLFAGSPSENKGAHRVLELWSRVRELDASAKLVLAGTGRLYGDTRAIGRHGISTPEFESRYIDPLVAKFGSLDKAGVQPVGLLTPNELRAVYEQSSLGIVNLNWSFATETFCCTGVEMLASGLPVFGVARGALPETIGRSGGAHLSRSDSVSTQARELAHLISNPNRLEALGSFGRQFSRREYSFTSILDAWERFLEAGQTIDGVGGPWQGPRGFRYLVERAAGYSGSGRLLDWGIRGVRLAAVAARRVAGLGRS